MTQTMTGSAGLVRVSVVAGERRVDLALPGAAARWPSCSPSWPAPSGVLDAQTAYGGYSLLHPRRPPADSGTPA